MRTVRARWSYILSCQGGVAATLTPSFLFFVFLLCDRHGRSHALGFYRWGESGAHEIASWHTPWTPLSEVAKAITGTQRIKKVNKQFVRAGCGTRPSREGRAEGGVRSGPLLIRFITPPNKAVPAGYLLRNRGSSNGRPRRALEDPSAGEPGRAREGRPGRVKRNNLRCHMRVQTACQFYRRQSLSITYHP